jgi:putative ABC transport system permease protein
MDILPILATLKRHKTAAGLIVLQVALSCAIVCNALFLISLRVERMSLPNDMAQDELLVLKVSGGPDPSTGTRADLAALRQVPGVKSAAIISQIPYGDDFWGTRVQLRPEQGAPAVGAVHYRASEGWLQTTGLHLVAGRDFTSNEYQDQAEADASSSPKIPAVIINQALAQRLFPKGNALGQAIYTDGPEPHRVVGVLKTLMSPRPGGQFDAMRFSILLPVRPSFYSGLYLLRVEPAQQAAVMKAAVAALEKQSTDRLVLEKRYFTDMRSDYYRDDRHMAWLMGGVCAGLLMLTAFGIVGLASFWVQQRTRMIGTRRALGATQAQILRYFQLENFLLSSLGILLGMGAAYGISLALMMNYELPRLPWGFLPAGALILWLLGQIAVLAPARRAAKLPPVAALRGI